MPLALTAVLRLQSRTYAPALSRALFLRGYATDPSSTSNPNPNSNPTSTASTDQAPPASAQAAFRAVANELDNENSPIADVKATAEDVKEGIKDAAQRALDGAKAAKRAVEREVGAEGRD